MRPGPPGDATGDRGQLDARRGQSHVDVLEHQLGAVYLVLDIVLGLVWVIVDAATGAWYTLEPRSALVAMTRVAQGDGPDVIHVALSTSTNEGARVVGVAAPAGVTVLVEER